MRLIPLASLALLASLSTAPRADVVQMPTTEMAPVTVDKPAKGITMAAVLRQYGAPSLKHPAVGGGSAQQPPITRWDYPAFSVIFEHDHVVDAVIPGQPPAVQHVDELQSTTP